MTKLMPLKPRMSEKAYGLSKERNTYMFVVPKDSNKATIAEAVAVQFDVTVENVNITNIKGKPKRSYRRGGRAVIGKDADIKKAYVRIKDGDHIPVFAAIEEEEAQAEKAAEKADKNAAKAAKKEKK